MSAGQALGSAIFGLDPFDPDLGATRRLADFQDCGQLWKRSSGIGQDRPSDHENLRKGASLFRAFVGAEFCCEINESPVTATSGEFSKVPEAPQLSAASTIKETR